MLYALHRYSLSFPLDVQVVLQGCILSQARVDEGAGVAPLSAAFLCCNHLGAHRSLDDGFNTVDVIDSLVLKHLLSVSSEALLGPCWAYVLDRKDLQSSQWAVAEATAWILILEE